MNAWSVVAAFVIVAIVFGVVVKLLDVKRRREGVAIVVQAHVSDALLRQPDLLSMRVTPTAHVPLLKRAPVTLELVGEVPSEELRGAVVRLVEEETSRLRPDVHVHSRIAVVRPAPAPIG